MTKESWPLAPLADAKDVGFSSQNAFVISDQTAFMVNFEGDNYRMQEITLGQNYHVTKKTIAPIAQAENMSTAVREYDPNYALKLAGLGELTPTQLAAFDKWWNLFILGAEYEHIYTCLVYLPDSKGKFRDCFMDYNPHRLSTLPKYLVEQGSFCEGIWKIACMYMGKVGVPEHDGYRQAKLAAIRTLSDAKDDSFTWGHFKRGYKIIQVWSDRCRRSHAVWENEKAKARGKM